MKTLIEAKLATESFQSLHWNLSSMQSNDLPKYLQGLSAEAYIRMLELPEYKRQFIAHKIKKISATKRKISNISQIGQNQPQNMEIKKLQCKLDVGFAAERVLSSFRVVKSDVASERSALTEQSKEPGLVAL